MLMQIKPDAATQHAQFLLVSYYRLSARLGKPVRQHRMLRHLVIEMWINLQKIGWQRCTPPSQDVRLLDGAAITNRIDRVERFSTGISCASHG
jgi:hypothetical protein